MARNSVFCGDTYREGKVRVSCFASFCEFFEGQALVDDARSSGLREKGLEIGVGL